MNPKVHPPRSSFSEVETIGTIANLVEEVLSVRDESELLGEILCRILGEFSIPRSHAVRGAIASDFARVAQTAMEADGKLSEDEKDLCFPIFYTFANFLATVRPEYAVFEDLGRNDLLYFLLRFKRDENSFGHRCDSTRWIGLDLCRRVAHATGDREPLDLYIRAQSELMERVFGLGGMTEFEQREMSRLKELMELRQAMLDESNDGGRDSRATAFCDPDAAPVFSSIARSHQVWERDPFDVESVHADAREHFARLVDRATSDEGSGAGRMLLIRGESGAGKTHLMRAFRAHLHRERAGFASYMQMSSRSDDYARYALVNVVDALERPHDPPEIDSRGLMILSDALAEAEGGIAPKALADLREGDFDLMSDDRVSPLVDDLLELPRFAEFDPDLLRVVLYLQRREPRIRARVLKYLRCEHLNPYDCKLLGGIAPVTDRGGPQRMLTQLGRLMWSATGGSMVFLVDQLEDITNLDDANSRIPRAIDVLRQVVDDVPSAVVVLSCLDDLYSEIHKTLTRAAIDRLEKDPPPIQLSSTRSTEEVEAIVGRRLEYLYDSVGVRFRDDDPLYPFTRKSLESQNNKRARDVLDWCHQFQLRCVEAGRIVESESETQHDTPVPAPNDSEAGVIELERQWSDFRAEFREDPPDEDDALLSLLRAGIEAVAREFDPPLRFDVRPDGDLLEVQQPDGPPLAIAMANTAPQGGRLGKHMTRLAERRAGRTLAMVRCSDYPSNPKTQVVRILGKLLREGARKIVCEDADWRMLMAFTRFAQSRTGQDFELWRVRERPLGRIRGLRELLDLARYDKIKPSPKARIIAEARSKAPDPPMGVPAPVLRDPPAHAQPERPRTKEAQPSPVNGRVELGHTKGLARTPVDLALEDLCTHAAFLGSTGSGKTTLALHVIEQALLEGIPVIMFDRKGDLCTYARPSWTASMPEDPGLAARKRDLVARVSFDVYTPGAPEGRHLGLSFASAGLRDMSSHDRNIASMQSAAALGAMARMNPANHRDETYITILGKAIDVLAGLGDAELTLPNIIELIASEDEALINAIGHLDPKHFKTLVNRLETLRLQRGHLLDAEGEGFDLDHMLSPTAEGKARLSVLSTKFLDPATVEFWVSRALVELAQWASRHPSPRLQAIVMFDEADIYMPAQRKPATKEPMQSLLKRARSAGVGVFLCTQSPGDLDYRSRDNIRSWFLGRIGETTAINKMRPLLTEARTNIDSRLSRQSVGEFFMLRSGKVTELKADRSLMDTEQLAEDEILELARQSRS